MDDQFLASKLDAMRERGSEFWHVSNRSAWPLETRQYMFLANAVDTVGKALFQEWTGNEPHDWSKPVLDGRRRYCAGGADTNYAMVILQDNRPDLPISKIPDWSPYKHPLQETDWQIATEIYLHSIAPIVRPSSNRMDKVIRVIVEAAASGELEIVTRPADSGAYLLSPAVDWNYEPAIQRFYDCQMNPDRPLGGGLSAEDMLLGRNPKLLPGHEWIFVKATDLDCVIARISHRAAHTDAQAPAVDLVESMEPRRTVGRLNDFKLWLRNQISASPLRRTMTKNDIIREGQRSYNLSARSAESARTVVINEFEVRVQKAWKKSGPTNS